MQNNTTNMEELGLNVRKSYRLLYDYQNHILKLIKYIESAYGLTYEGGNPLFSNPSPRAGKGNLNNWAWDWLNMYFYEFHFSIVDNFELSIFLVNDTGFYQNREESINEEIDERLDLNNYASVEKSETKLIFAANKGSWTPVEHHQSKRILFSDNGTIMNTETGIMLHKAYSLFDFSTEENTVSSLKDFSSLCKEHHIPLLYRDKVR